LKKQSWVVLAGLLAIAASGCGSKSGGDPGVGSPGGEGGHQGGGQPSGELAPEELAITRHFEPWRLNRFHSGPRLPQARVLKRFTHLNLSSYETLKLSYSSPFASCAGSAPVEYRFSLRLANGSNYPIQLDQEIQVASLAQQGGMPYELQLEAITSARCESISYEFAVLGKQSATGGGPFPGGPGGPGPGPGPGPFPSPTPLQQPALPMPFPPAGSGFSQNLLSRFQKYGDLYCRAILEHFVQDTLHVFHNNPNKALVRQAEIKLSLRVCDPSGHFMGHAEIQGANERVIAGIFTLSDAINGSLAAVYPSSASPVHAHLKARVAQLIARLHFTHGGGEAADVYPHMTAHQLTNQIMAYRLWGREMNEWVRRQ
jgi:hypothetical protein